MKIVASIVGNSGNGNVPAYKNATISKLHTTLINSFKMVVDLENKGHEQ